MRTGDLGNAFPILAGHFVKRALYMLLYTISSLFETGAF